MSQARIIINVSDHEHSHANGLSGVFIVPAKKENEDFGMLCVYPTPEIQDIGDQRRTVHWPKVSSIALDIVSARSDATAHTLGTRGGTEKWGLVLCEAEPDLPKELLVAHEEELNFLNDNPPDYKSRKDKKSGAIVMVNVEDPAVTKQKLANSERVQKARTAFEKECRSLVMKSEVARAKQALRIEDARLVAEGDEIYGGPEAGRKNINELHKRACRRLKQERDWCYIVHALVDCPGCGASIKENVLSCEKCGGWLEEGIETLRKMPPKERARVMYPERYSEEEMTTAGKPRKKS